MTSVYLLVVMTKEYCHGGYSDFKKFFKEKRLIREKHWNDKKTFKEAVMTRRDNGEDDDEKVKDETCLVAHASSEVIGKGIRKKGLYVMKLGNRPKDQICLATIDENSTLWHRRLGHANMCLIQSLASKELVRNLPKLKFDQHFCDACKIGKQAYASHKAKNIVSTTRCLGTFTLDFLDHPPDTGVSKETVTHLVVVDDLSRVILGKTPYEILRGRKPTLDYFRVFGSMRFILNTKDYLTKFDLKSYEGVFLGYFQNSKAYIILNKHTRKIEESLNVTFDETPPPSKTSPLVDDDFDEEEAIREIEKKNLENDVEDETLEIDEIVNIKESRNHPLENAIGYLNQRTLRSQAQNQNNFYCFISTIEPKNVNEALGDESWIVAMQEELNQFITNDVWELVPQPKNMTIIGTKWVFRNKLDENGVVSRTWLALVAQDYNHKMASIMMKTYCPVSRLSLLNIISFACRLDFKLFQMDVKSAFLNGFINEEVYVAQPPGFIDFEKKPDHVYNIKERLYMVFKQRLKLEMLKKFGLKESKPMKTPMSSDTKLTKVEEYESVDSTKYRSIDRVASPNVAVNLNIEVNIKFQCLNGKIMG
ncbi:retrovirus-related pol polyprotein from transposon TNT 1-94 [Tanacetum coccineum]